MCAINCEDCEDNDTCELRPSGYEKGRGQDTRGDFGLITDTTYPEGE